MPIWTGSVGTLVHLFTTTYILMDRRLSLLKDIVTKAKKRSLKLEELYHSALFTMPICMQTIASVTYNLKNGCFIQSCLSLTRVMIGIKMKALAPIYSLDKMNRFFLSALTVSSNL